MEKKYRLWFCWRSLGEVELMFIMGKVVNVVIIMYLFIIKLIVIIDVIYKVYLKGNFIVMNWFILIKLMFNCDKLLKRIVVVIIML